MQQSESQTTKSMKNTDCYAKLNIPENFLPNTHYQVMTEKEK